ncbi:granzyme B(G,H)-like [Symphorus nematophorus]
MSGHGKLVMLILALTLDGQVHAGRILRGHEAVPHSRPYMVILEKYKENGERSYCDGFLLSEDFVMTAAHCQARSYEVLLGVHNFHSNDIKRVSVEQAFPHKDYNNVTFVNDIMLVKLSSKATFNENVKPIALAGRTDGSLPKSCLVSGWGETEKSNYMSAVLREANVTLIDHKLCDMANLYCSEGEPGPGRGDSGGPLVCEGKAYGVVSHTFKPQSGDPDIHCYAKIPDKTSWIDLTIKNA